MGFHGPEQCNPGPSKKLHTHTLKWLPRSTEALSQEGLSCVFSSCLQLCLCLAVGSSDLAPDQLTDFWLDFTLALSTWIYIPRDKQTLSPSLDIILINGLIS